MFPVCFPRSAGFCLWLVLYVHVLASAMANVDSSYCLVCLTRGGVRLRTLSRGRKRLAIFAIVGVVCFAVQLALLTVMVHLGAYRPVANAVAFAVSAQLNFLLSSRVTWRDRPAAGRGTGARWLAYNGTALLSLGCNTAVFAVDR